MSGRVDINNGEEYVANIRKGKEWVEYSKSNSGEEDYYRDVFIDGQLAYCDGETCRVKSNRSDDTGTVKMVNIFEGIEFEISIEQFEEDFKKATV